MISPLLMDFLASYHEVRFEHTFLQRSSFPQVNLRDLNADFNILATCARDLASNNSTLVVRLISL